MREEWNSLTELCVVFDGFVFFWHFSVIARNSRRVWHTLYDPEYIGLVLVALALALGLSVADMTVQFVKFFGFAEGRAGLVVRKLFVYMLLLGMIGYLVFLRVIQKTLAFS